MGETRAKATARLPSLQVEISHHRCVEADTEQISIHLRAVPSFEAFAHYLESINPLRFWAQLLPLVWTPWLPASRMMPGWDFMRYLPHAATERSE